MLGDMLGVNGVINKTNSLVDSIRIHIFASFKHCDMKKLTLSTILALMVLMAQGQSNIPRVYEVENTGWQLAKPVMPEPDQLPVIRELPDALEGVTSYALPLYLKAFQIS